MRRDMNGHDLDRQDLNRQDWDPSREPHSGFLDEDDLRPLGRSERIGRPRLAVRCAIAAGMIAGLTLLARERAGTPEASPQGWTEPPHAAVTSASRVAVPATAPLLRLVAGEGEPAVIAQPPRWNPATGLREDALAQGGFDAIEAPFLRVTLTEGGAASDGPGSLFVALARRAAETRGLAIARTALRGHVATRLGTFETVEATLSGEGSRACTGFQSLDLRNLRIDGWLCGILGQAPEPRSLACTLDRLALSKEATASAEDVLGGTARISDCGEEKATVSQGGRADSTGSIIDPAIAGPKGEAPRASRKNQAVSRQSAQAMR